MEKNPAPAAGSATSSAQRRTALVRILGVALTAALVLVLEFVFQSQLSAMAALGLLALAVVFSANRGGPILGLSAALIGAVYISHLISGHGDPTISGPFLRSLLAAGTLAGAAVIVGLLRVRLDRVVEQAERERATSQVELRGARADAARAQSAARLQARLLDEVGQAVVATDIEGHVIYANRAAAALFGREPAAMQDRSVTEVAHVPEPQTGVDDTLERIGRNAAWIGEALVRTADGPAVPMLVTDAPLLDADGKPTGIVRVLTDLTSLRKAERNQRILADAGAVLSASSDYASTLHNLLDLLVPDLADVGLIDLIAEDGNAERLDARHVDPDREVIVRELRSKYPLERSTLHPAADVMRHGRAMLLREIQDPLLREIARDEEHLRILRMLGYRSGIIVPLRTGAGTLGALSLFRTDAVRRYDDNDLRLAEELARRAGAAIEHARLYEQAVLANRAKSDFLAVMSHELRTPLTTVIGYSDLMLGGVPQEIGEQALGYVRRVRSAADHLLGLIDQILVYSRLELGRLDTQPEQVSASDVLREVAVLVEPIAHEQGLDFSVTVPEPFLIETDLGKLRQILLNLLTNAVKFTERGHVELEAIRAGDEVRFITRDTGAGIAPEHLEHIFDSFWQVDQSSTRRAGGTGLGLTISRRLARLLGGDIEVDSTLGQGSVFCVRLPVRWRGRSPDIASLEAEYTTG